jgi:hypothetical protein
MVRVARQCKDDAQRVHFRSMFGVSLVMSKPAGMSINPGAAPMSMLMFQNGQWSFMLHGQSFLNHTNASGLRGGEKTFSTNWVMATATRPLGRGAIAFRAMLSLEPATITQRSYPELFQTGETAFGKPLIDGQHPHDFFMEPGGIPQACGSRQRLRLCRAGRRSGVRTGRVSASRIGGRVAAGAADASPARLDAHLVQRDHATSMDISRRASSSFSRGTI